MKNNILSDYNPTFDSSTPAGSVSLALDQFRQVMAQVKTNPVAGLAILARFPGLANSSDEEFERTLKLITRHTMVHRDDPTVMDSVNSCLLFKSYTGSAGTALRSFLKSFRTWIEKNHGPGLRLSDLTLQIMQTWKNEVMLGTGTSISKDHRVAVIGMWTRFCIDNGWLHGPFFPRQIVKHRPQPAALPVCWTLAQSVAYLARIVLYRPDAAAALIVYLQTGLPFTTIIHLVRANFHFSDEILVVPKEYSPGGTKLEVWIRPSLEPWFNGMASTAPLSNLRPKGLAKVLGTHRHAIGLSTDKRSGPVTYFSHLVASGKEREEAARIMALEYARDFDRLCVEQPAEAGQPYLNLLPPAGFRVPPRNWKPPRPRDKIEAEALHRQIAYGNAWQAFLDQANLNPPTALAAAA